MRMARWAAALVKRIAAGRPVPSPKVKADPRAGVTRRGPVAISFPNAARGNRSIGRILPRRGPCRVGDNSCSPRRHAPVSLRLVPSAALHRLELNLYDAGAAEPGAGSRGQNPLIRNAPARLLHARI